MESDRSRWSCISTVHKTLPWVYGICGIWGCRGVGNWNYKLLCHIG